MTRLLVVDRDEEHRIVLSRLLRRDGFEVAVAPDGDRALTEFESASVDLVLLDLALTEMTGTELCRRLRQRSEVPIIIVTTRDSEIDKVVALEVGADDYVTKPYSPRELVARVRAVLRRGRHMVGMVAESVLMAGPVHMDVERHLVTLDGASVPLPLREFDLLKILLRNAGRVLTRRQLIERVWGPEYVGDTKTLDTHVRRLRGRLEADPSHPKWLLTVRGVGYQFQR
ncbi:response regulator transcription factor [Actinomycetes bacterium KLBMP 9797]